ncbi:MAG: ergothioneine biosynthesis protein EgtB, partial [Actinomycetota bacterium]
RPEFRFLFNSYYEAVGARHPRPERGLVTRPSVADVTEYRQRVDEAMWALLDGDPDPDVIDLVVLGTHHEEQHQELLLIDIKHVLSANPAIGPAYVERVVPPATDPGPASFVEFDGGTVEVGAVLDDPSFVFDNEGPRHEVRLYPFALADRLVTAGEWTEFIADGGYERPELWKSDGWHRCLAERWNAPLYWRPNPDDPDSWWVHTLTGLRAVDPYEPVCHVSHYEADAFATWAGARLPTEFEWEHALDVSGGADGLDDRTPSTADRRVLDLDDPTFSFHPGAATGPATGGLRQMIGDCWEWTSSAYQPYPGFSIADGAIGEYNGKFMSGQQVLRGGGALTPPGHTRATYRNFFHPHTRWHLGGLRLAVDASTVTPAASSTLSTN